MYSKLVEIFLVNEHNELHQTTLEDEDSYKLDLGNVNHNCSLFQLFDSIDFLLILLKFPCFRNYV